LKETAEKIKEEKCCHDEAMGNQLDVISEICLG
jgi:hypothetical protein